MSKNDIPETKTMRYSLLDEKSSSPKRKNFSQFSQDGKLSPTDQKDVEVNTSEHE